MKRTSQILSQKAVISLENQKYLALIMVLAPLLNFLAGIAIDLYAPSMPAIALYFHAPMMVIKNTITATTLGFAVGCLFCGVLFDTLGRKKVIISALALFILVSLLAPHCQTISQLMLIRFAQGLLASAMTIGGRALASDHFTGHQFVVAVLYTSLGYGLGPVIAPFIGGYLQDHFDWQANFYAYAFCGATALILFILLVQERFKKHEERSLLQTVALYKTMVKHKAFLFGAIIGGLLQIELMMYPTVGPFIVEHELHYSAIIYGNTALIVGLGYLSGVLVNRFMLRFFTQGQLMNIGFIILLLSLFLQFLFSLLIGFNLWTIVSPILLVCFGIGFIFGNIFSNCLKLFPGNTGMASALQVFLVMLIGSAGLFVVSYFTITTLTSLVMIYLSITVLQLFVYLCLFRKNIDLTT